jgi:hypothetical protein
MMEKGELTITKEDVEREAAELADLHQKLAARRLAYRRLGDYLWSVGREEWLIPRKEPPA